MADTSHSAGRASLDGAFIVLGVTGSIAAYKAVEICRQLVDAGAHVVPVLTKAATRFIGAATFSALASEPAKTSLFDDTEPIPHTRLGRSADLIIIAPASATILGELSAGLAQDLLSATLLCTTAPVMVCPAMHTEMWLHPSTQENLHTLRRRGVNVVEPESGRLAGGDHGVGRLADPGAIVDIAAAMLARRRDLAGLSVLVTAGGTREAIDPVRFIGNRSSGKQGHAIAAAAAARGASVTLVTTSDIAAPTGAEIVAVESAAELEEAVISRAKSADIVVMAAAVADFRPANTRSSKWKKRDGVPQIELEQTPDILSKLVGQRPSGQVVIGFAAETDDALNEGAKKLAGKGADFIVINDVSKPGVGFGHDTNAVTILRKDGHQSEVSLASKSTIADAVLDEVVRWRDREPY